MAYFLFPHYHLLCHAMTNDMCSRSQRPNDGQRSGGPLSEQLDAPAVRSMYVCSVRPIINGTVGHTGSRGGETELHAIAGRTF